MALVRNIHAASSHTRDKWSQEGTTRMRTYVRQFTVRNVKNTPYGRRRLHPEARAIASNTRSLQI